MGSDYYEGIIGEVRDYGENIGEFRDYVCLAQRLTDSVIEFIDYGGNLDEFTDYGENLGKVRDYRKG